jgi:hypothetical protein
MKNYKHYLSLKNGELNIYIDGKDTMVEFCTSNKIQKVNYMIFEKNIASKTDKGISNDLKTSKYMEDINGY